MTPSTDRPGPAEPQHSKQGADRSLPSSQEQRTRFDALLRWGIERSGLSLSGVHSELERLGVPVSVPTLSKWQNGSTRPSGVKSSQAVLLLEQVLGLPGGSLQRLMPPGRPRGPRPRASRSDLFPELARESQRQHGAGPSVTWQVWHETVTIDAAGMLVSISEQSTITALRDGVTELISSYHDDHGQPSSRMVADALYGCAITEVSDDLEKNTRRWRLGLDRCLNTGDSTSYAWVYRPERPFPFSNHSVVTDRPFPVLAIEVIYPPEVALRVEYWIQRSSAVEPRVIDTVLPCQPGRTLVVLHDPPPAGHGLSWHRDEQVQAGPGPE